MKTVEEVTAWLLERAESYMSDARTFREDPAVFDLQMATAYTTIAGELRSCAGQLSAPRRS